MVAKAFELILPLLEEKSGIDKDDIQMHHTEDDLNVKFKDIIDILLKKINLKDNDIQKINNDIPKINNVEKLVNYFAKVMPLKWE